MKEIGKFLQLSVKSSSLVAAASHSLSVNCKHTLERSFHLSLFLSCLHLLSPHSSSSFFLLYSFYHWFLPFFLIFSVSNNTAFNFFNISLTSALCHSDFSSAYFFSKYFSPTPKATFIPFYLFPRSHSLPFNHSLHTFYPSTWIKCMRSSDQTISSLSPRPSINFVPLTTVGMTLPLY